MPVVKPKDLNAGYLKKIEDRYGKIDMKNDFFSGDLDRYMKTSNIESESLFNLITIPPEIVAKTTSLLAST